MVINFKIGINFNQSPSGKKLHSVAYIGTHLSQGTQELPLKKYFIMLCCVRISVVMTSFRVKALQKPMRCQHVKHAEKFSLKFLAERRATRVSLYFFKLETLMVDVFS